MGENEGMIQSLLAEYPVFERINPQKLRCTLTGHELTARLEQLETYLKTSKFIRAWKMHQIMEEYGDYFDDLGPHHFGCIITRKIVAKNPDDLLRHVNGKKFKKALEKELNEESESSNASAEGEEEMEENTRDVDMVLENDDSSDDGGVEMDDDEYPELARLNGEAVVESESHDFAVMDTEKDMNSISRKRKADSSTTRRTKRSR